MMRAFTLGIIALFFLTSCAIAPIPKWDEFKVIKDLELIPSDPDKGTVVFYKRERGFVEGGADTYYVWDADRLIGGLRSGCYFHYLAEPGTHIFWSETEASDHLTLDVEAGKVYHILGKVKRGRSVGIPDLKHVPNKVGGSDIADLKYCRITDRQRIKRAEDWFSKKEEIPYPEGKTVEDATPTIAESSRNTHAALEGKIVLVSFADQRVDREETGNGKEKSKTEKQLDMEVTEWVMEGVRNELQNAGFQIETSADVAEAESVPVLNGHIKTLDCTKTSRLYEGVFAESYVHLHITLTHNGQPILTKTYRGEESIGTISPLVALFTVKCRDSLAAALSEALHDLIIDLEDLAPEE